MRKCTALCVLYVYVWRCTVCIHRETHTYTGKATSQGQSSQTKRAGFRCVVSVCSPHVKDQPPKTQQNAFNRNPQDLLFASSPK